MTARVASFLLFGACYLQISSASAQEKCFTRLDTGTDMTGWHKSTTNHHGPGDGWSVENGAFVGKQTAGNKGGILMTDKSYKDVEVIFQVKIDWGCDSGFFFRTTAGDRGYQVNLDHLQDAGVGTIYGEGFAQELRYRPYFLSNMGMTATKDPVLTPLFDLALWPTIWKPTDFNEVRARVEGNPPHMQVWIANTKVMDFTDAMLRQEIDATGPLAIQVHGGAERWIPGGSVSFKNIRVKDLTVPCLDEGVGGASGAGGSGGVAGAAPSGGAGSGGAGSGGATNGGAGSSAGGGAAGAAGASVPGGAAGQTGAGAPSAGGGADSGGVPNEGYAGTSNASPPTSDDAGGCSCRLVVARNSRSAFIALLLAGLVWRRRRAR